jgi:predicted ATP-binding protein involved in virulence
MSEIKPKKIQQISVNGLFGIFDHVIPLNLNERITIMHSPNGFGKTTMLRMLNGFFNSRYSVFRTIPFSKFQVGFNDGSRVEVIKTSETLKKLKSEENISFNFYKNGTSNEPFLLKAKQSPQDLPFSVDMLDEMIPELVRLGSRIWRHIPTGENLSLNEVVERFEDVLPPKKSREEPEWLEKLKLDIHVRLIESQRLLNFGASSRSPRSYASGGSSMSTVSAYSAEIAQLIQFKLAEYGTIAQSLDRTFPARVVRQRLSSELTIDELREQLVELEETRSRLIKVGLLDKEDNSDFQIPQSIDESTKNILSVYVEDAERKLSVFNEIASKFDLLRRIINDKFSYKEMNFDKDKGFIFNTDARFFGDSLSSSARPTLSPTDLSSGEQHELVLLYELLFKVEPDSLVLIDEPELSLHVGWQAQFLNDLQEITKLAKLDVLMATHSPDIIQDRWDLTMELKGIEK